MTATQQQQWSVAGVVRGHAQDRPDHPALLVGGRETTWRQLDERSNQVAHALRDAGVQQGDRVAFIDKNSAEYFETLYACAKIGAVQVAVNWRLAPPEMAFIVNDSRVGVLVVHTDFAEHLKAMKPELEHTRTIVVIGGDGGEDTDYEEWVSGRSTEDPGVKSSLDDVAMQLYTSGTTGLPKGAMLTNDNLAVLTRGVTEEWSLDASSVNLVAMPLFHIGGSGWALAGMHFGCTSLIVRELADPAKLLEDFEEKGVTNAFLVPAVLQVLSGVPGAADREYRDLRSIVYGASPITDEVLKKAMQTFKCDFIQVYGLTETTGAITMLAPEDHDPGGERSHLLRSAGKPFDWIEFKVVGADSDEELPRGEVGELLTKSSQNFIGYWDREEQTEEVLTGDNWFHTGDAGYIDEDGYIFITDRIKDMIVSGGENVYPIEVENALANHPDVADVAVFGVPSEKWGETVKAAVVPAEGSSPTEDELISFAKERLAGYKCPTSVDFIEGLPRNPSGKILKKELRDPYWEGRDRAI